MGFHLVGAISILVAAQAPQATIAGVVRSDETGEPLAGAVVTLVEFHRIAVTDADGRYHLPQVSVGSHVIQARFIGYTARTLQALVPDTGLLEIDVSLRPHPLQLPQLEVLGGLSLRGEGERDANGSPDRGVAMPSQWSNPLLAEPDAFQALAGGEVVLRPESPAGIHVRGGGSDQVAYLLDGIPVFSPYHVGGAFSAWNPDALARLDLTSASPAPEYPEVLSGVVSGVTRSPERTLHMQGGVSATQMRLTIDGPAGVGGVGYMLSFRRGFPGSLMPLREASYLQGHTGDWLGKVEVPTLGGHLELLGYDSWNQFSAASGTRLTAPEEITGRNVFEWHSRSLGAEWKGVARGLDIRISGWSAVSDATSEWAADAAPVELTARRNDAAMLVTLGRRSRRHATVLGFRLEQSRTSYGLESDSATGPAFRLAANTPVATLFGQHQQDLGSRVGFTIGTSLAAGAGRAYLGPRAQLGWGVTRRLALSASYARLHQFAQSLRNPESVVGSVFPVELYLGAGDRDVPVAHSDQGVLAVEYRPAAGLRFGGQAYAHRSEGLLLVAPRDGEPFSTGAFAVGTGMARGVALDAALRTDRLGLTLSYGLQHVRLSAGDSSYVPDHGATHLLDAGVIVLPTRSSSIRLGLSGAFGRRSTIANGGLEWESCNLLDQGCEFGGSPNYNGEQLGAKALPYFMRLDLGVRHQWSLRVGGRPATMGLYGTVTNLLGRKNVLTYVRNPATGGLTPIELRPFAPLVVGVDWRF